VRAQNVNGKGDTKYRMSIDYKDKLTTYHSLAQT